MRPDWEQVKDDVMRKAVLRKFELNPEIRDVLLSTGDEELVEKSPRDYYWGCGADGNGLNSALVAVVFVWFMGYWNLLGRRL